MNHPTLEQKREQMINFLLENIVCREIERWGNDVVFEDHKRQKYLIKALSKPSDIPYDFEKDPKCIDNDADEVKAIEDAIKSHIVQTSPEFVTGFVLLEADKDYDQLNPRTKNNVNSIGFLQQDFPSPSESRHYYNRGNTKLKNIELALLRLYKNNNLNQNKRILAQSSSLIYYPELIYFRPKLERDGKVIHDKALRNIYFADLADASRYEDVECPVCNKSNNQDNDHESCKQSKTYISYVRQRTYARYSKMFMISKERKPQKDSSLPLFDNAKPSIRFMPAVLNNTEISLPESKFSIAVLK